MSDNGFFTGAPGEGRYPMCLEALTETTASTPADNTTRLARACARIRHAARGLRTSHARWEHESDRNAISDAVRNQIAVSKKQRDSEWLPIKATTSGRRHISSGCHHHLQPGPTNE